MNERTYLGLLGEASRVGEWFSNPDRKNNFTSETFRVEDVVVLSDHRAVVVYEKSSGLRAVADFVFIPAQDRWLYYFPTDSHFLNLAELGRQKFLVEQHNRRVRSGLPVEVDAL